MYDYLSTSQPPSLDPPLLKQLSILSVSIFIGVNIVVIALKKKKLWRKAACRIRKDRKISTDQRKSVDPSTISALLSAKLYNQS